MDTLLAPLTLATNSLTNRLDEYLVETGMLATEYLVLLVAGSDPQASAADVRRSLGIRDAAYSTLVRRLVARGYVREWTLPRDRRTRRLELTGPGIQAVRIASSIHDDLEGGVIRGVDRFAFLEQLKAVARSARRIEPPRRTADGLPACTA